MKGIEYQVGQGRLINKTVLSFSLLFLRKFWKYIPSNILNYFSTITLPVFSSFAKKNFQNTDVFVFESTESVFLYPSIKGMFSTSKIVYRPSDPLIASKEKRFVDAEVKLLKGADFVFLVNEDAVLLYKQYIKDFDLQVNYSILPNGVDTSAYLKTYEKLDLLKLPNIALYVGARPIEWNMIVESAELLPDINFIIICSKMSPLSFIDKTKSLSNLHYINGIDKQDVPKWVTNADLIIVPNPKNLYKYNVWGITAKYYQAMVAKKPIVAYHDSESIGQYGIKVTYNTADFVSAIRESINTKPQYDFQAKDWNEICSTFYQKINQLCSN
jgi:hypothetical protein